MNEDSSAKSDQAEHPDEGDSPVSDTIAGSSESADKISGKISGKISPGKRSPERGRSRRSRRWLFPLMAIFVGVLPLLLMELVLTVMGIADPQEAVDPFSGFGQKHSLFAQDGDQYTTSHSRRLYFGMQEFSVEKSADEFRIFGLGGSTMRGRPYETPSSLLKWVGLELDDTDREHRYTTVNCGGLSYASYRLSNILDEVVEYDPDLIVVATGHNEYLEDRSYKQLKDRSKSRAWMSDRFYSLRTVTLARRLRSGPEDPMEEGAGEQLSDNVKARLDEQSGYSSYERDDQWRKGVVKQYGESLRNIIDTCKKKNIPLVLVNVACNLRDCPPFKSVNQDLSTAQLSRFQKLIVDAQRLETESLQQAVAIYRQAVEIDDRHALLHFRLARCYDELGEFEDARKSYVRARQEDIVPVRATEELHELCRQVAKETNTPIVDAQEIVEVESPERIPGNDQFVDHVHPSIAGHQLIGKAVVAKLREENLVPKGVPWTGLRRRAGYRKHLDELGSSFFNEGAIRVKWLEDWARRYLSAGDLGPVDDRGLLHSGQKHFQFGRYSDAWTNFRLLLDSDVQNTMKLIDFAYELFEQGRFSTADRFLRELGAEPKAKDYKLHIDLARTIIAFESGRTQMAQQMVQDNGLLFNELEPSTTPWRKHLSAVSPE